MHTSSIAALLALSAVASAQSFVSPSHFTRSEGTSSSPSPLGSATVPYRTLQIHSGVTPGTIRSMAFRLDTTQLTAVGAFSAIMELSMSTAVTTPAAPSATFDSNHGADRVVVVPLSAVQFPAAPTGFAPRDFLYVVNFTTPFNYTGTGPLCWDMKISNRSSTTAFTMDAVTVSTNPPVTIVPFGAGCIATGASGRMTLAATASASWTNGTLSLVYTGSRLPANSIVSLSVGTSATSHLGLALPFELPLTSGAPSGTCYLYNEALIQVPVFTTSTGGLATGSNLAFTINPALNGVNVFTQVIAVDPTANGLGLVTSNSIQQHLVAPFATAVIGNVVRSGSVLPTGTVQANRGTITRFGY